jgi:hypothetical protein
MVVSSVLAEFNRPYPELLVNAYPDVQTGLIAGKYPYKLQQVMSNNNAGIKVWINNEKYVPTKARWESSIWSAVSYSTASSGFIYTQMNGCLQSSKGMLGQVSTNATVYTISAPLWDQTTDSLSFTVAAPTYESDGDKKQGLYDLVLREDIAKCLWGKDLTKASAKIEILNADGTTQVATTTFKTINGYVYFRAAGFHYSVPNIKVSLVEALPKPRPSGLTVKKLRTVTCTKGKMTKSVSDVNPKCPSGYKKKA